MKHDEAITMTNQSELSAMIANREIEYESDKETVEYVRDMLTASRMDSDVIRLIIARVKRGLDASYSLGREVQLRRSYTKLLPYTNIGKAKR